MSAARPVVAVLGAGSTAWVLTLEAELERLLKSPPACPPLFDACTRADQAQGAHLRWLLAWEPDTQDDAATSLAGLQAHQALRQDLQALNLSYQVLRGAPSERLRQALHSLASCLPELAPLLPQTGRVSRRPGYLGCDSCSDPDCEHLSFTRLIAERGEK